MKFKYLFGPVPSRRLGLSLGVDLVPYKVCSFDCVYCECGRTTRHTIERKEYVPSSEVLEELKLFMENPVPFQYVTFSGYGEPLLNSAFGGIASWIKDNIERPLALLTNSSLLVYPEVRREASLCDVVLPSLDAATQSVFERINRPCCGISVKDIVEALRCFKREYLKVKMALEILFVKGINDGDGELKALKDAVEYIEPDEVHLNTVDRPPADDVEPVSRDFLREVAAFIGGRCVVVGEAQGRAVLEEERLKEAVLSVVKRRPLRVEDMSRLLGSDIRLISKLIALLEKEGLLVCEVFEGQRFYRAVEVK